MAWPGRIDERAASSKHFHWLTRKLSARELPASFLPTSRDEGELTPKSRAGLSMHPDSGQVRGSRFFALGDHLSRNARVI